MERLIEMIDSNCGGIVAIWHDRTMLPIYYCRHKGLWAMISLSRDGELQNRLVRSRGYKTIRGSSGAQGVRAFLEAAKRIKEGAVIAITPDGPRGPAKVVQAGTVLLADRAGCDILPIGVACNSVWKMNSWDKHTIPKPFSRALILFGSPVKVRACATEKDKQAWAEEIARALNEADAEADALLFGREKQDARAV